MLATGDQCAHVDVLDLDDLAALVLLLVLVVRHRVLPQHKPPPVVPSALAPLGEPASLPYLVFHSVHVTLAVVVLAAPRFEERAERCFYGMPAVPHEQLVRLQERTECLRNICILAHVDHGKTSLSDCLLASNGIISPKSAGKIRFLDSREDEQSRGITMESSAISLYCKMRTSSHNSSVETTTGEQEYLVNLIDSPGHVDFSSEVSTASRLCDGALVLVDVVEGVCSQTVTVLQEVWRENLKPILIFNKMDRLITELRLSPSEAYSRLSRLLEQVNAVLGGFFAGDRMKDDLLWREAQEQKLENDDVVKAFEEKDDEELYFLPERGNVVFGSAVNGWAFTISQFAEFYEKKLGLKTELLNKVLWGDFYLDAKSKRVFQSKHVKGKVVKPMFVQFVLENIWAVYDCTIIRK